MSPVNRDTYMDELASWKSDVDRRLAELFRMVASRPQLEVTDGDFEVSGGGAVVVKDGGGIILETPDGTTRTFQVVSREDAPAPNGDPQPAVYLCREDGSLAMSLDDPVPLVDGYRQIFRIWDRQGHDIMSEDATSGFGLARPYIPGVLYPAIYTDWVGTTNSSYETVLSGYQYAWGPRLYALVNHTADTSGAAGNVRLLVDGAAQGGFPVGFVINTSIWDVPLTDGDVGQARFVEVQARRTSGTGKIRVSPRLMTCLQSS